MKSRPVSPSVKVNNVMCVVNLWMAIVLKPVAAGTQSIQPVEQRISPSSSIRLGSKTQLFVIVNKPALAIMCEDRPK